MPDKEYAGASPLASTDLGRRRYNARQAEAAVASVRAPSVEIVKQGHDTKGFVVCRGAGWPSCCAWRLNIDGDRGNSERVPSLKLTQRQRGGSRKTTTAERPWIAAGPAPTPTTTRLSTRFIERMRCSSTRNRASAHAASATFKPLALLSRTETISQCGGCSAPPTSGPLN